MKPSVPWQFAVALGLIPLSFAMWWFGLQGAWWTDTPPPVDPHPVWHLMCGVVCAASPFVALTGATWIFVLMTLQIVAALNRRSRIQK